MEPAGVSEVARELGISRQRLADLRQREGFPSPVTDLSSGPIWDLEHVRRWAVHADRSGGRPTADEARRILNDRFELLDEPPIGSGGFADVYRAVDLRGASQSDCEGVVAIKLLRSDDADGRARFARELRLHKEVDHPHIVRVLDAGEDADGRPWYAMPLAVGSLADELPTFPNHPRCNDRIADVMEQVCAGLAHLHDRGVWHRDLTPANVLRTRESMWAISDFGLARERERRTPTLTSTSAHLGTFLYQAPEQMGDAKNAGPLADIYSLGKVLEAMIVGGHPIPGGRPVQGVFRAVVLKATKQKPHQRYQSVQQMLDDVRAAATAPEGEWEPTDEALERLRERLRDKDAAAANEVLELADRAAAARDDDLVEDLTRVIPYMTRENVAAMWEGDPDRFLRVYGNFTDTIGTMGYEWAFCDVLADFCQRVVSVTRNEDVLRYTTNGLAGLGYGHNRWHVQTVLLTLLQEIRTTEMAMAALDGLREARESAVEWSIDSEFALRTLHPILRDGLSELLGREAGISPSS